MQRNTEKIVGHRLRFLRTRYEMSQKELGAKIGCSQRYISVWESGEKLIPTKFLFEICQVFSLNLLFFDPRLSDWQAISYLEEEFSVTHLTLPQTPQNSAPISN